MEVENLKLRIKELEQKLKSQQRILDKFTEVFEIQEAGVLIINSNVGVRGDIVLRHLYNEEWFSPDGQHPYLPPRSKDQYEQERLKMIENEHKRQEKLKEKKEFEKATLGMLGWLR